jgi:hypothetical protein
VTTTTGIISAGAVRATRITGIVAGARRLLRAIAEMLSRWNESYYADATRFGSRLNETSPEARVELALRWHARDGRFL